VDKLDQVASPRVVPRWLGSCLDLRSSFELRPSYSDSSFSHVPYLANYRIRFSHKTCSHQHITTRIRSKTYEQT